MEKLGGFAFIFSSRDLNPLTNEVISAVADLRYIIESESVFELKNKKRGCGH